MRVLITGAGGFIGRQIVAAITAAGHDAISATRAGPSERDSGLFCDFAQDTDPETWLPRLEGIDAVVNCAGILRERGGNRFEQVHVETPSALYRACVLANVRRVIQVSALGDAGDGEFIASKHRGDAALQSLDLEWVVLRPSVVYSPRGSYGGTSLLRAMAALPGVLVLPGTGMQLIQPVSAEDFSGLVVSLLAADAPSHVTFEITGPETLTLESYLRAWRSWLGLSGPRVIRIPIAVVAMASWAGERLGTGPLGRTMYRMLSRGNIAKSAGSIVVADTIWSPHSLAEVLARHPSFTQDRWHARLYFVAPLIRALLGFVWLASAFVGFATSQADIRTLLGAAGIEEGAVTLVYGASAVDFVLGALLLLRIRTSTVGALMIVSLIAYTVFISATLPGAWLEPFGGLLKNLVLIPAVLVVIATADRK